MKKHPWAASVLIPKLRLVLANEWAFFRSLFCGTGSSKWQNECIAIIENLQIIWNNWTESKKYSNLFCVKLLEILYLPFNNLLLKNSI